MRYFFIVIFSSILWGENSFVTEVNRITDSINNHRAIKDEKRLDISDPFAKDVLPIDNECEAGCCPINIQSAKHTDLLSAGLDNFSANMIIKHQIRGSVRSIEDVKRIPEVPEDEYIKLKKYIEKRNRCLIVSTQVESAKIEPKKKRDPFEVQIIFEDRAKIADEWYVKGDEISGYIVKEIGSNFVKIQNRYSLRFLRIKRVKGSDNIVMEIK
jgi:hypothetical protein